MVAKKEFFNNRLLVGVLVAFLFISIFQVEITGDAFKVKFPKQFQRYISTPQQKTATLTTPTQPAVVEKTCVTNNDCSAGYSCKPVTKYTCQKDTTTTVTPTPTIAPIPAAPSCSDKIKNQDETDIDCGGSTCSVCANGKICNNLDSNCASQYCNPGTNKCENYIPKLRLTASTTATANCPTGTTSTLTRATKYLWVSKVPNPTSLTDFTQIYSGTNNWYHYCGAPGVGMVFSQGGAYCTSGQTPCCRAGTQFVGDATYGYSDARSSTVIQSIRPLVNSPIDDTGAWCAQNIKAIDVTTNKAVDTSKLGCPTGYSSAGIISEDTSAGLMYTHFCVQ